MENLTTSTLIKSKIKGLDVPQLTKKNAKYFKHLSSTTQQNPKQSFVSNDKPVGNVLLITVHQNVNKNNYITLRVSIVTKINRTKQYQQSCMLELSNEMTGNVFQQIELVELTRKFSHSPMQTN